MNCIEKSIDLVKSKLQFKVVHNTWDKSGFFWEFKQKKHFISTPAKSNSDEFWELLFLHELIHALHKETLPIKFSIDPTGLPCGIDQEVANYFNTVRDWFVLGNLLEYCPKETKFYIEKEVEEISGQITTNRDVKDRLIEGMLSAESKLILGKNFFTNNGKDVLSVRNELLKIDPKLPSVDNLAALVNELFNVFGYFKLHISTKEHDDWKVKQVKQINCLPKVKESTDRLFKKLSG